MSGATELAQEGHMEEGAPTAHNMDDVPVVTEVSPVEEIPASKPSVGERLRAGREARGMDTDAVAAALKLSKRQVEALETGDWAKLPGHTFIRGFVRNYARVAQLDADALLADLDAPAPKALRLDVPQNATAVMPQTGQAQRRDYAAVLGGIVLVAVAVVAYYVVPTDLWMSTHETTESAPKETAAPTQLFPPGATSSGVIPMAEPAAPATPASASGQTSTAPVPPSDAPVTPAVVAAPAAAATPAATTMSATGDGKGLRFAFAQPSWIEVRDKSGQIIYSQLNPAGSVREVDGQPPFTLVVGNAAHVTVQYRGRTIELQPRSKDDVARVTVE